ncbi:amino acid adenylation domain-containing protein [Clostridium butyricum]
MNKEKKIENIYALSPMQLGMYSTYLRNKSSDIYFRQAIFSIEGAVDLEMLKECFNGLAQKYEALRTVFVSQNLNKPMQVVLKQQSIDIAFEDISIGTSTDKKNKIDRYIENDREKGFDLAKGPLIRGILFKSDRESYKLIITFHHIILDGWCLGILLDDLFKMYNSKINNISLAIDKVKPYKEYIEWLEKKDKEKAAVFWNKYLEDYNAEVTLPKNSNKYSSNEYKQTIIEYTISEEKTKVLEKIARSNRVTLNTVFESIWGIILQKCNNTDDVVFGSVISGRQSDLAGIENIMGLCINSIPKRIRATKNMKFTELIKEIQTSSLSCQEHGYYPLNEIQKATDLKENLFDQLLAFENYPVGENLEALNTKINGGFKIIDFQLLEQTNYNLTIIICPGREIKVIFNFNSLVYDKEFINKIPNYINNVIEQLDRKEEINVCDIKVITEEEKIALLNEYNGVYTECSNNKTIQDIFEQVVMKYPENKALTFNGEHVTYNELNKRVNKVARFLRENSVKRGDIVAIMFEPSFDMIVSILAIVKAGGVYLPIDPKYPINRIEYTLKDSKTKKLLTTNEIGKNITFEGQILYIDDKNIDTMDCSNIENVNKPTDLAYIIYTSGTTNNPKGVMIQHSNLINLMLNTKSNFEFSENDVWTMFHSFCFDFSVWEMYGALMYGGRLVIVPKIISRDGEKFLSLLRNEKVTVLNQTPTAFYYLSNEEMKEKEKNLSINYIVFGGESLNPTRLREWKEKYPDTKLINMYGITETTVHVTYKEITGDEIKENRNNVGKPIPSLKVYIMDSNMNLVPKGVRGEICVAGGNVGRGYLNKIELTKEKFVPNPYNQEEIIYRSGDLGQMLSNGDIEHLGRIDHQVKIRGFRIELGEVETAILKHPVIKDAVVIAKEVKEDKFLCAYIVANKEFTIENIREHLLNILPSYMMPSYFVELESIPMNTNGKVDISALPEPKDNASINSNYEAPENRIQEKILEIFAKVLDIDINKISINDSFFSIGGDSIKVMSLVNQINKQLNFNIKISDIYINPTIKEIDKNISSSKANILEKDIVKVNKEFEEIKEKIIAENKNKHIFEEYEDIYPMSDIEQGMIFHSILNSETAMYHDQVCYKIDIENFNFNMLKEALSTVTKKHDILRTYFNMSDFFTPIQIVSKTAKLDAEFKDISMLEDNEQNEYIEEFLVNDRKKSFNIKENPLWKVRVFGLSDNSVYFSLIVHHSIMDGWSVAAFITEVINTYSDIERGNEVALDKLSSSYKDFVLEQNSIKKQEKIKDYWKNELEDYKEFRFQKNENSNDNTNEYGIFIENLGSNMLKCLKEVASRYDTSIKNICFAAYSYMLYMCSYDNDLLLGLVENNRPECNDGEKILGCFLNTIPVRIKIGKDITYKELLKLVDNKLVELKAYNKLPLNEITKLILPAERNGESIVDNLFNFVDFHIYKKSNINFDMKNFMIDKNFDRNNADFDFTVSNTLDGFGIKISYNENVISKKYVGKLIKYYIKILNGFIENPRGIIKNKDILLEEEKQQMFYKVNNTERKYQFETVDSLLESQVQKTPDKIALIFQGKKITYNQLDKKSNQIARTLKLKGIKRGDKVPIIVKRSLEMIIGIYGILKAGAAYIPVDPEYPSERIMHMLEDCNANIVLSDKSVISKLKYSRKIIDLYDEKNYEVEDTKLDRLHDENDLAYIIYTSGSTGRPKGVMLPHRSVNNFINAMQDEINFRVDMTMLAVTTMSFDIFVLETLLPLSMGLKIVIANEMEQKDPALLSKVIERNNINIIQMTPSRLQMLLSEEKNSKCLVDVEDIIVGGEDFPKSLLLKLKEVTSSKIYNVYGPTETTVWSAIKELTNANEINIGLPIANTQLYIINKNNDIQPIGVEGELCIAGKGLAKGYLGNELQTKEKFIYDSLSENDLMYKTGDLVKMLPNGEVKYLNRLDNQVKIRGFRIEIEEIQTVLEGYKGIEKVLVLVRKDKKELNYIVAYIVSKEKVDIGSIREYCSNKLPAYMLPNYIIQIEEFPLMPNGKLDKRSLPKPGLNINERKVVRETLTTTEQKLVDIVKEVLCIETVEIEDNFFEIGGCSIKAAILIGKINRNFNVNMPMQVIFNQPKLISIANWIDRSEQNDINEIEVAEKQNYYPVLKSQESIFVANDLMDENIVYNMPTVIKIYGQIDKEKLNDSFEKLIQRHEPLRTFYKVINGKVQQVIRDKVEFEIDCKKIQEDNFEEEIKRFVRKFELTKPCNMRALLCEFEDSRYGLVIDLHHIVIDGISANILVKDLFDFYSDKELSDIKLQFKDYCVWFEEYYKTKEFKNKEMYWTRTFSKQAESLSLPIDFNRGEFRTFSGRRVAFEIDPETTAKIKAFANNNGTTLFNVLMAAYKVLLFKYSEKGKGEIVVGSPISTKCDSRLEQCVGMFVNTLPIKSFLNNDITFVELLQNLKKTMIEALDNREYPLENLLESLEIKKEKNRNPIFDTVFIFQKLEVQDIQLDRIKLEHYEFYNDISKFDFTLQVIEENEKLNGYIEYNKELFMQKTIEKMSNEYRNIINTLLNNEGLKLGELKLELEAEIKPKSIQENIMNFEFNF